MGIYHLQLKSAGGLKDEDFLKARKAGQLDALLASLPLERELKGNNQLNDWIMPTFAHNVIGHGFPNGPWPTYDACVPFNSICLTSKDEEPDPEETYGWYGGYHQAQNAVGGDVAGRGFTAHRAEDTYIIVDPDDRESVRMRTRWIYLPSYGNSNNIRGITINGSQYSNQGTGGEDRYQVGRIRFKDPTTGVPVILVKNLNQVLIIEYTAIFVSL